jgi:hypothetical protein
MVMGMVAWWQGGVAGRHEGSGGKGGSGSEGGGGEGVAVAVRVAAARTAVAVRVAAARAAVAARAVAARAARAAAARQPVAAGRRGSGVPVWWCGGAAGVWGSGERCGAHSGAVGQRGVWVGWPACLYKGWWQQRRLWRGRQCGGKGCGGMGGEGGGSAAAAAAGGRAVVRQCRGVGVQQRVWGSGARWSSGAVGQWGATLLGLGSAPGPRRGCRQPT